MNPGSRFLCNHIFYTTWQHLGETDGDDREPPPSPAMCAQQRLVSVHSSLTIDHTSQNPKDLGPLSLGKHIRHIRIKYGGYTFESQNV